MGKVLIVAEKPSVAKDIALALGGFGRNESWLERADAVVAAARGHLCELYAPEMETSGRTLATLPVIPEKFEIAVIEDDDGGKRAAFELLKRLMLRQDVDRVVNACDAGREGELIFRLIYNLAGCNKPVMRLWCQSMTPEGIREAYRDMKPSTDYDPLGDSAFARSESDYVVGINGSRGATRLHERQTATVEIHTIGRVQTPTGAIVYDREMAIRTFKPENYWEIHGQFGVAAGSYTGQWFDPSAKQAATDSTIDSNGTPDAQGKPDDKPTRIFDKSKADAIVAKCKGVDPSDVREESKPSTRAAPRLYDLTQLQREANRKFRFTSKKTLDLAQELYETHKVTTYPRTDSSYLPEDYVSKARSTMESLFGAEFDVHARRVMDGGWVKPDKRIFDNSKISDHFAIVPTGKKPENLSPDEAKIYDLVVRRFLAAFHPAAQYQATTRITIVAGEQFKSSGKVLVDEGWLAVYGRQVDGDDKNAPPLVRYQPNERVTTQRVELKSAQTKAPPRYTEDTLLGAMASAGKLVDDDQLAEAMKAKGLGTPATRASIIERLVANKDGRGKPKEPYLKRIDNVFHPTPKLMALIPFLRENGLEVIASPALTGDWEYKLHLMERRQYTRKAFRNEIAELTRRMLDVIRQKAAEVVVKKLATACPQCGGEVSIGARAYACEAGCGFQISREIASRALQQNEVETLLSTGTVMNLPGFISKETKRKFTACLRLTDEHKAEFFFDPLANTKDAAGNAVHCPTCEQLMRRVEGKRGFFWSCTDRENCKTNLDDKDGNPVPKVPAQPCPKCNQDMNRIPFKNAYFWACSDREGCGHTMNDRDGVPVEKPQSYPCPDCGKAMYRRERRTGRGGYLWGCSGYKKEGNGCNCILDDDNGAPVPKVPTQAA